MIASRRMVFRFTIYTNPLSHRDARTLALAGKRFGLDVRHEHDRAWFERTNLITAEGSQVAIAAYRRYLRAVLKQMEAEERETA
jgi:hypothetical protein